MELQSIETRDEIGLVAFGPKSRIYVAGTAPVQRLVLDPAMRIVWLYALGHATPHGIPLEQVRRFQELPAAPVALPAEPVKRGPGRPSKQETTNAPKR